MTRYPWPGFLTANPAVADAVAGMDALSREICRLMIEEDWKVEEVARVLGLTPRRCEAFFVVALEAIRKAMKNAPRKRRPRKPRKPKGADVRTP